MANTDTTGPDRLVGARIETVPDELGPASEVTFGSQTQTLRFGGRNVVVHDGRVVSCR